MEKETIYQKIVDVSRITEIPNNKFRIRVIKITKYPNWFRKGIKIKYKVKIDEPEYCSNFTMTGKVNNNEVFRTLRDEIWEAEDFINDYKYKTKSNE